LNTSLAGGSKFSAEGDLDLKYSNLQKITKGIDKLNGLASEVQNYLCLQEDPTYINKNEPELPKKQSSLGTIEVSSIDRRSMGTTPGVDTNMDKKFTGQRPSRGAKRNLHEGIPTESDDEGILEYLERLHETAMLNVRNLPDLNGREVPLRERFRADRRKMKEFFSNSKKENYEKFGKYLEENGITYIRRESASSILETSGDDIWGSQRGAKSKSALSDENLSLTCDCGYQSQVSESNSRSRSVDTQTTGGDRRDRNSNFEDQNSYINIENNQIELGQEGSRPADPLGLISLPKLQPKKRVVGKKVE
jgi:hypothetical protein